MRLNPVLLTVFSAALASGCGATMADQNNITIYSRAQAGAISPETYQQQINNPAYRQQIPGYAVIRTLRPMSLERGLGQVSFTDVAAGIDPTTVNFKSLTAPDTTRVLEQNYQYDLVNTNRILEKYLEQEITVQQVIGDSVKDISGTLLASQNQQLVLQLDNGELFSSYANQIRFPALPDGLITRPTLQWQIETEKGGQHDIQVSYESKGMTWWADYNAVYREGDGNDCEIDLAAWVTIVNQTGASFDQAKLKLIAGDVNRAEAPQQALGRMQSMRVAEKMADNTGFAEKSFFEYHLYTLGRPADLPDRSIKQLELFPTALNVPCEKKLVFDAGFSPWRGYNQPYTSSQNPYSDKADIKVFLEFDNKTKDGLGIALPKGRLRVSQEDIADGNLEFIGEDNIDHTPRNETISIKLGNAFDVVGERKQANFKWNKDQRWMEETIEVRLRNQKDTAVVVNVRESLFRWSNWELKRNSHEYRKKDAATVDFAIEIAPEGEQVLTYTARYTW